MQRFLRIGLLATTMLAIAMPAAAQRGEGRGNWGGGRPQTQAGGAPNANPGAGAPRGNWGGRMERQRDWSSPRVQTQPGSAVGTTRVPPSSTDQSWRTRPDANGQSSRGNWQGNRGGWADRADRPARSPATPSPVTPPVDQTQRPDRPAWNGNADRRPGDGQSNGQREARRDNDHTRDWNRAPGWRGGNAAPGWRGDNAAPGWRGNDRGRDWSDNGSRWNNNRNWNNGDNRWNDNRGWNGRRLNDRDRWAGSQRWDNRWRNDRRYDWQDYRAQHRYRYRMPAYYAPYGWNYGYQRFSIGIFLGSGLFASNYWLDDPYSYRLPPAYGSLRWIRYYDDALLVDIRDGYVVDVIHDFFW